MHWHDPWLLLLLLPWALAVFLLFGVQRPRTALTFSHGDWLKAVPRGPAAKLHFLPKAIVLAALLVVIFALARPQVPDTASSSTTEGIDIVLVLDLSSTMLAMDFQPQDRATVAKAVTADFIRRRPNDRVSLVAFAGEAYTQAPLTLDHRVVLAILETLKAGQIEDGTAIGNALGTGINRLRESKAESRIIVLVTDGDNNAGNISPMQAAEYAKQLGIKVFTIQVGKGGEVPYPFKGRVVPIAVAVNPELLRGIAAATGGKYYVATDGESLAGSFQAILDELKKSELEDLPVSRRYLELAAYLLFPALLLLVLALVLRLTRFKGVTEAGYD